MHEYVNLTSNQDESEQMSSFQNGTIQGFGNHLAVTVQAHLAVPAELTDCTQEEAVAYIEELLLAASNAVGNRLVFDVQIGRSAAFEKDNLLSHEDDSPSLGM